MGASGRPSPIEVHVLGPVRLACGGRFRPLRSPRKRAVLAALALDPFTAVPADRLVDAVWGEHPPASAGHAVQVYVSELRKLLAIEGGVEAIRTDAGGYALVPDVVVVDAVSFEELVARGRAELVAGRPAAAEACFDDALGRWRGEPFTELGDHPLAQGARARLDVLRDEARDDRVDARLADGRHREVLAELEERVRVDPLRERPYRQLMVALYRADRQADALDVYQRARLALRDGLGLEPGPLLRATEQAIIQHDAALGVPTMRLRPAGRPERPPFVGRDRERAELAAMADTRDGPGSLVLIGGEAGIGKSRLAEEVASYDHGRTVLFGRCPSSAAPALWPFAEALRPLGALTVDLLVDRVGGASLRPLLAGAPAIESVDERPADGADAFALYESGAAVLAELARRQPTLLVLDDLQWADAATLGVLARLGPHLRTTPLLVIGTHRDAPGAPAAVFVATYAELARDPRVVRYRLGPLGPAHVHDYARGAGLDVDDATLDALVRRSEGNALFLTELIASLIRNPTAGLDGVPAGLQQILAEHLRCMGEAQPVLSQAALIGRSFPIDVLARAVDGGFDEVVHVLDEADRAGLVRVADGDASFSHELVADAAAALVDPAERRLLHLRIAEAWAQRPLGDVAQRAAQVAHHRVAALPVGDPVTAAQACLEAGRRSAAADAYEDAAIRYAEARRALGFAPEGHEALVIDALVGEAECRMVLGAEADAVELLDAALVGARRIGDVDRFALAVRVRATARSTAGSIDDASLRRLVGEALEGLDGSDSWLRVQLLCDLAGLTYRTPDAARGLAAAEEALRCARRLGEPMPVSFALTGLHQALLGPDTLARRLVLADEAIATAELAGIAWQAAMGLSFRAADRWEAGDLAGADEDVVACARLADRSGRVRFRWVARSWRALFDLQAGRLEEAEAGFTEALSSWGERPNPDAVQCFAAQQLTLALLRGTAGELTAVIEAQAASDPEPLLWQALLSYPLVQGDRLDAAAAKVEAVMSAGLGTLPRSAVWPAAMAMLAEAVAALGDGHAAAAVHDALRPFAGRFVVVNVFGGGGFCWSAVNHQLGVLARTAGDDAGARHWLSEARDQQGSVGARAFLSRTEAAMP